MKSFQQIPPGKKRLQPKLNVNKPGDRYEQEADAMADHVVHGFANKNGRLLTSSLIGPSIQRKCSHCEEEEKKKLMRKEQTGTAENSISSSFSQSLDAARPGGAVLPSTTRLLMEDAFQKDFSSVRIHNDAAASSLNNSISARAFTFGNDIYFNQGQYQPQNESGMHLLAHELTHVVQQGNPARSNTPAIQRTVSPQSSCAANSNGSPSDPLSVLQQANDRAVMMALGASHLLFLDSLLMQDPSFGSSGIADLYRRRFDSPLQVVSARRPTRFRNRFNRSLHATSILAEASEMQVLSDRFKQVSEFLDGNIDFSCPGTGVVRVGDCDPNRCRSSGLQSCSFQHRRDIAVCPAFWSGFAGIEQKAIGIIHEGMHMLFHMRRDFDTAPFANTAGRRVLEPECFASLVADIYGISPADPSCPAINVVNIPPVIINPTVP